MKISLHLTAFLIFLSLSLPKMVYSSTDVLFQDSFDNIGENGKPLGWLEVLNPPAFSVLSGSYNITVPADPFHSYNSLSYYINNNWIIDSIEVEVLGISGPDRFLLFRYDYSQPS